MVKEQIAMRRLLASAAHDLRNVLAVLRESSGLAQDKIRLEEERVPHAARLLLALDEVQRQIRKGAALADGLTDMSREEVHCELSRATRSFCVLMARHARARSVGLEYEEAPEPIMLSLSASEVFIRLLEIFDDCAVAGGVTLRLKVERRGRTAGVAVNVLPLGGSTDAAATALEIHAGLTPDNAPWRDRLLPWRETCTRRFWLELSREEAARAVCL